MRSNNNTRDRQRVELVRVEVVALDGLRRVSIISLGFFADRSRRTERRREKGEEVARARLRAGHNGAAREREIAKVSHAHAHAHTAPV